MTGAHLYHGRSQHPVLHSWEGMLYVAEIFCGIAQLPWWKRWWRRPPSMLEPFVSMTWELCLIEKGQRILAEARPDAHLLDFPRLEKYRAWLDEQVRLSDPIGRKTQPPPETAKWPDDVFYKQYLFEINGRNQLVNLFDWFRSFEMMDIFLLNVDAKLEECAHQLQQGVLDRLFDLEMIVESLNAFVYCNSFGDRLIIESPRGDLIESFFKTNRIEPISISSHPLARQTGRRSLWLGKRRLLP